MHRAARPSWHALPRRSALVAARSQRRPFITTRQLATVATPTPSPKDPTDLDNITTLPNGIRVASEALPDAFSGVGVYIDAGSRYETPALRGASHIMDRLAFKSTGRRTADDMLEAVERLGGNIQCASSRECMMYQAATFNAAIPTTVALLAETVRQPLLTDQEIAQQLRTAEYEIQEIWSKPDLILPELLHMAAFKDNTLGNPLLCPQDRLAAIDKHVVAAYRETFYRPERIVVAFAGIPHSDAVSLSQQYFGDMDVAAAPAAVEMPTPAERDWQSASAAPSPSEPDTTSRPVFNLGPATAAAQSGPQYAAKLLSKIPLIKNISTSAPHMASVLSSSSMPVSADGFSRPSHYTGGFLSLPAQPPPLNPHLPTFTHIQVAFEGLPISSDDIYALAALQTLLGGGGSFSAGGPGKGMYSRLYTNVLNQHGWVESCVAFNHSYTDSGLFGIAASCYPGRAAKMLDVMCRELRALTLDTGFTSLGQVEVNRAKNQLRSSLLMNLESRMVELEDLGRQVQVHGRKIPVHEMMRRIDELTVDDLRRVARMVVGGMVQNPGRGSGAPTVVLQEAEAAGVAPSQLGWAEIQDVIYRWQLGRR